MYGLFFRRDDEHRNRVRTMKRPITASDVLYRFGSFTIDPALQTFYYGDTALAISRKAFAVLMTLVERHGSLVERNDIFRIVWPDVIVEENNLDRSISVLRQAMRQHDREHDYILTVSGRGYQFTGDITQIQRADLDSFLAGESQRHPTNPTRPTIAPDAEPPAATSRDAQAAAVRTPPADAWTAAGRTPRWSHRLIVAAGVCAIVGVTTAFLVHAASATNSIERFWRPVLTSPGTVAVVVGPAMPGVRDTVTVHAARAAARVAGFLDRETRPFEVKSTDALDFADLRAQPMVAIGAFNNPWTRKITDGLRFRLDRSNRGRIFDNDHPDAPGWATRFDSSVTPEAVVEDFALIARVRDPASGQHVVCFGGIRRWGTSAAGELLTTREYLDRLAATAPAGWDRQNVELVIATTVTGDVAGPPRIVATYFWK
jgi:DNA-binding winged helix-turn-helix (wHTH) protein